MKRGIVFVLACAAGLVFAAGAATAGQALPMATLSIGDDFYEFGDDDWTEEDGLYRLVFELETDNYEVSADITGKYDPFAAYGFDVYNMTGSPLDVILIFGTPMMSISDPIVYSSFAGSTTDIAGDGTELLAIAPDASGDNDGVDEIQHTFLNDFSHNAGVDVGTDFFGDPGTPGHSDVFGPFEAGPMAGPTGTYDALLVGVAFSLSDNDIATMNGFTSVNVAPIPEPGSLALLGLGLIGAGGYVWRRRRA